MWLALISNPRHSVLPFLCEGVWGKRNWMRQGLKQNKPLQNSRGAISRGAGSVDLSGQTPTTKPQCRNPPTR